MAEGEGGKRASRRKATEPSSVDAMGQDKRRVVIGQTYGPTRRKQILFFVGVAAVGVVLVGGWLVALALFDTSPDEFPDKAPWSSASAPQNNTPGYHPRSPSGPCGEPGSPFPQNEDSPCAEEATSEDQPAVPGAPTKGALSGSGGVTNSGGDAK